MAKMGYSEPKLHNYSGNTAKEWYVDFYMTNPDTHERRRFPVRLGDINYHKNVVKRTEHGQAICRQVSLALQDGWNPFIMGFDDYILSKNRKEARKKDLTIVIKEMAQKPFNEAIRYAFDKKKKSLEPKSISCIKTIVECALSAASQLGINKMPIGETETPHIMFLLDRMMDIQQAYYDNTPRYKGKKVTGNLYNKYAGYLSLLFTEMKGYGCVKENPCFNIEKRSEIDTNIHRHATNKEHDYIRMRLSKDDPMFFTYLLYEYYLGIREKEIFGLKISDFDSFNQGFKIHATEGRSKDKTTRLVPIPDVMMKDIEAQKLYKYPKDYYIFSSYFEPGTERRSTDYATKRWRYWVKDKYGLDVTLYSFKGKGGEDKRRVGVDFGAVSAGMGHSSLAQTVTYVPSEIDRMNEQLKMRTPKF